MEPVFMALKKQYQDQAKFIVADFNKEETFILMQAESFDVPYIPMFFFIDTRGNVIVNEAGLFSIEDMARFVDQIID
jgi:thioredoxin-related protein